VFWSKLVALVVPHQSERIAASQTKDKHLKLIRKPLLMAATVY